MNERQRFIETMTCGSPDRPSYGDYLSYDSTRLRWESEGMPKDIDLFDHFGFDHINLWRDAVPCNWTFGNVYIPEVIEETPEHVTRREGSGMVNKYLKNMPPPAMPMHVSFPVSDRDSWERHKKKILEKEPEYFRFDFTSERAAPDRILPLGIWAGSTFGIIRDMMGLESAATAIYDSPGLIGDMMEFLSDYYVGKLKFAVEKLRLDWVMFWEDMAYKNGSLISPAVYKSVFMPFYEKIMPVVEAAGIKVVMLDSDGCVSELTPLWLDAGITTMHPMEAASGMDVRTVRKKYGRTVKFLGGIDKRALALGKEAIDKEVAPKIKELLDDGGFIVECDHAVPPDVSYDNFRYYRDLVRRTSEK